MNLHQHKNRLLGLAGLAALPVVVAACGGVPGNAVATVDGSAITKKTYDHWANAVVKSSAQGDAVAPDPPNFTKCVAAKREKLPKPGKGVPKTSDQQLKSQCKSENTQIRDQTMGLLVSMKWIKNEAEEMNIKPSEADLKKNYDEQVKQGFPNKGDLDKFFKQTGLSASDLRQDTDNRFYQQKILEKLQKDAGEVKDADITAYYNKNKARFAQPVRRDLLVILTKTKAKAEEAKAAVEGGTSFAAAAKEFSIDDASKAQGGKLEGVAKGQQEAALDKAVFAAKKNQLTGPVKTQFGFYVFRVTKELPASQQSLEEAKPTIKQIITQERGTKAQQNFSKRFEKKWREKTECADGFKTQVCKNGPKPKASPAPGGQPQGDGGGGQAPPQGSGQSAPPAGGGETP